MVSPALREGFPPQATGEPEGGMGQWARSIGGTLDWGLGMRDFFHAPFPMPNAPCPCPMTAGATTEGTSATHCLPHATSFSHL
ncbi:MAG: hypothetical protein KME31_34220 [Tolypothrix carrinoi HA7290-LM1]|nr:hypothetical protein [Tolypothrix carrinoi HA7290-LM1]